MRGDPGFEIVALSEIAEKIRDRFTGLFRPVVLVVDDERIIADTLGSILDISGYTPLVAYDGESALDLADLIPPDLLISDVVMPGMSGVDLAMALCERIEDFKVLLFSGQAATLDLLADARAAGYNFSALAKPIHPSLLLAQVSEMVPRYATQYLA